MPKITPFGILLIAIATASFLNGCAECRTSSDCDLGQVCMSGECQSPDTWLDTDTSTDTDVDTDTDTDTDADTDTDTDTDTDVDYYLVATERCTYCEDYAGHEVLIGPSGSADPESEGWTVAADSTDMNISGETASTWYQGYAALLTGITDGDTFRVAYRYTGQNADKWYVEDLCITTDPTATVVDCVWEYGFDDCTGLGTLAGTGWAQVDGAADESAETWRTSVDTYVSSPTSATIDYDNANFIDNYLVSADITIPSVD